jgi:hypothetical protein
MLRLPQRMLLRSVFKENPCAIAGSCNQVSRVNTGFLAVGLEEFLCYFVYIFGFDEGDDASPESASRHAGTVHG